MFRAHKIRMFPNKEKELLKDVTVAATRYAIKQELTRRLRAIDIFNRAYEAEFLDHVVRGKSYYRKALTESDKALLSLCAEYGVCEVIRLSPCGNYFVWEEVLP